MGADFTLVTFPYFDMTDDRRQRFADLLESLPQEATDEYMEWFGLDEEECLSLEDFLDDIETACSICSSETSTLTTYNDKGERYELNVTGGMSWGDPPTDAYDAFNRAAFFESIYDLAIDYAVDYVKMYQ